MKADRYTKIVLALIAIRLFLNAAINLRVTPAEAKDILEEVQTKSLVVVNDTGDPVVGAGSGPDVNSVLFVLNKVRGMQEDIPAGSTTGQVRPTAAPHQSDPAPSRHRSILDSYS